MSVWTRDFSDAQGWNGSETYYGSIRLADVNGDGLADVCGRGIAGIYCNLSRNRSPVGLRHRICRRMALGFARSGSRSPQPWLFAA